MGRTERTADERPRCPQTVRSAARARPGHLSAALQGTAQSRPHGRPGPAWLLGVGMAPRGGIARAAWPSTRRLQALRYGEVSVRERRSAAVRTGKVRERIQSLAAGQYWDRAPRPGPSRGPGRVLG